MRQILRLTRFLFVLIVIAGGILAALNWPLVVQIVRFSPIILPTVHGSPESEAEANVQDLRYLRKLTRIDRSFSDQAAQEFDRLIEHYSSSADEMTKADLYLAVARLGALADNGHTGISAGPLYREFNRIGVKLYWFADGLYVVRAVEEQEELIGARVISIEGRDVAEVQSELERYFGGVDQRKRLYGLLMMESPQIMHGASLASASDRLAMSIIDAEGQTRDIVLEGSVWSGENRLPARHPWMTLKPVPLPDEGENWYRALNMPEDQLPLYLRDSSNRLFAAPLEDGLYIRAQITLDTPDMSLDTVLSDALGQYGKGELEFLVVDLRWNPGGDYTKVLAFAKSAPDIIRDDGRLYIIVGPQTFSAALVWTALLKHYGSDKSVIVGQPMGDRERFWAERGMRLILPNSKFLVNYATGYHDWEKGCEGHAYCYSQNLLHQVPAGSLTPSILIEPTYESYASGRDDVLEWIHSQHD